MISKENKMPLWARKPKHNKKVIATDKGWMVEDTGEYLKLVKNLDKMIQGLESTTDNSNDTNDEVVEIEKPPRRKYKKRKKSSTS